MPTDGYMKLRAYVIDSGSAKPVLAPDVKASNRILIVDDLPEMRTLIRTYLGEETASVFAGKPLMVWTPSIKHKI